MITASKLAGFFAAHAIWCVSDLDGNGLIPMLAYTTNDDKPSMERLVGDPQASVARGKEKLRSNEMDADDAVLVYDARIPIGAKKVDAIILELRAYFSPASEAVLAVPYTPKSSGQFRVHKPKLLQWVNCEDFDTDAAFQAFFDGVDSHEKGAKVWNDCLDQSK